MTDIIKPYIIKASFRGIEFETSADDDEGGRRLVTHEYPNREDWDNEDLGKAAEKGKLDGYITEPDLARKRDELKRAFNQPGAGVLYHPYERRYINVRVSRWNFRASKDELGKFEFSIDYVLEADGASSLQVTNSSGLIADTAQSLRDQAVAAYLDAINAGDMTRDIRQIVDGYMSTAVAWVGQANALSFIASNFDLRGLMAVVGAFDPGTFGELGTALSLVDLVRSLTSVFDERIDQPAETTSGAQQVDIETSPMTKYQPYAFLMQSLRDTADISLPRVAGDAGQIAILNNAAQAIESLVSRTALGELGQAVLDSAYPDRDSAMAARYDFAQRVLNAQSQAANDGQMEIHQMLADMLRYVGEQFATVSDDLQPLDTLSGTVRRTSLSVAYDLYDDPTRALELIDRNGALNGSFLPHEIQYARDSTN
ncbi:DNA circularization family protein [Burkholderia sp. MSHR3999]|uniref:DNA circularization N-terminal domain-containing protein n=1 Tax=Burkholderia sp. MSHR3999 TaxID=1542965 RepID=UPI0005AC9196|nr:DNA circularization N-terminal domain-containing protein [Burkholderia sp. MSHR3999]KIP14250.1 DNA circularization family protein [Burkholderia sp. MSHR3999]